VSWNEKYWGICDYPMKDQVIMMIATFLKLGFAASLAQCTVPHNVVSLLLSV